MGRAENAGMLKIRRAVSRAARVAAFALVASGCRSEAAPAEKPVTAASAVASSPTSTSTSAAPLANDSPLTIARRLALADPGGNLPVDVELRQLQKKLEAHAEVSDSWVMLGRTWVRKARGTSDPGYYLNAKASADMALELAPSNRAASDLIGIVLLNQHRFDDARDVAQHILDRSAHDVMALGTLSDAYLEVGRYDEATAAAQRMMDMKPALPSYARASYLAWLRGDEKTALENIHGAIDAGRDPNDPEPRCWVMVQAAVIFWQKGDYPGADAGFKVALKECHDYPPALVGRGRVALAQGDSARAIEALEPALKESPLVETAWLLGDARQAAGDTKGAADAYAQAVKIGRSSDARTLALFWATRDAEHDEALRLAEAETKVRRDIYTEDTLAWALYRVGRFADARAASDKAMVLGTKDARLLYHAGAIRIAAGDKAAGEKLVRDALALSPRFDPTGAVEAAKLVATK
jgi:tetratricopeptide (TPR) repeat protein